MQEVVLLQNKALRIITRSGYLHQCKTLFIQTGIQTVANLYIVELLTGIFDNMQFFRTSEHKYNTRNRHNAALEDYRLSKYLNSHDVLSIKVYNALICLSPKYSAKELKNKFYG